MLGKLFLLLLLALGVTMAVPQGRSLLQEKAAPVMNGFKAKLVPMRLNAMADQLEARLSRRQPLPIPFEPWLNREFTGSAEDPWGRLYYLRPGRGNFTVGSMGPDGEERSADDITVTRQLPR